MEDCIVPPLFVEEMEEIIFLLVYNSKQIISSPFFG